MFEAGDWLKDALFTTVRRDDFPTADGCRNGDSLLWFVLLDGGFDSLRGCCLKASAYMPIAIADYTGRMPVPVVWITAAAKCGAIRWKRRSEPKPYQLPERRKRNNTHR